MRTRGTKNERKSEPLKQPHRRGQTNQRGRNKYTQEHSSAQWAALVRRVAEICRERDDVFCYEKRDLGVFERGVGIFVKVKNDKLSL